jgi:hypothetical protein
MMYIKLLPLFQALHLPKSLPSAVGLRTKNTNPTCGLV